MSKRSWKSKIEFGLISFFFARTIHHHTLYSQDLTLFQYRAKHGRTDGRTEGRGIVNADHEDRQNLSVKVARYILSDVSFTPVMPALSAKVWKLEASINLSPVANIMSEMWSGDFYWEERYEGFRVACYCCRCFIFPSEHRCLRVG